MIGGLAGVVGGLGGFMLAGIPGAVAGAATAGTAGYLWSSNREDRRRRAEEKAARRRLILQAEDYENAYHKTRYFQATRNTNLDQILEPRSGLNPQFGGKKGGAASLRGAKVFKLTSKNKVHMAVDKSIAESYQSRFGGPDKSKILRIFMPKNRRDQLEKDQDERASFTTDQLVPSDLIRDPRRGKDRPKWSNEDKNRRRATRLRAVLSNMKNPVSFSEGRKLHERAVDAEKEHEVRPENRVFDAYASSDDGRDDEL
ncbi:MAG: hypothetical protein AAGF23_04390 [Acidobacteriota bacterium]